MCEWRLIEGTLLKYDHFQLQHRSKCEVSHLFVIRPLLRPSRLPHSSRDAWDTLHDLGLWASESSVHAFFTGGDSHCLELLRVLFMFDKPDLSGAGASSSLPTTSSMITDGSAEDLVRSGVSSGDVQDSFNKGELHAPGVPHPFWGVDIGVLVGFLKKGWSRPGCMNVTGQIMAWPNLMVDLPATVGALAPPVEGELGRELTRFDPQKHSARHRPELSCTPSPVAGQ